MSRASASNWRFKAAPSPCATPVPASLEKRSRRACSPAETLLALHLAAEGFHFVREYRFAALVTGGTGKGLRQRLAQAGLKDWRLDFALPDERIAIEIEGGAWSNGRHTRGKGFSDDLQKYQAALRLGWNLYRCDTRMVNSGEALETVVMMRGRAPMHAID